jgi:hypothetical protein
VFRRLIPRLILACAAFGAVPAHAKTHVHALVIGNNQPFAEGTLSGSPALAPLRFADDDAAAFYELLAPVLDGGELLTVMDSETQGLYPELAAQVAVPSLAGLELAVGRLRARMERHRAAGDRNVVFFFFSGHGTVNYDGRPALALFDGGLSQDVLYRRVLEQLPADEVHLLIDACHAEAVVRPRDREGEVVPVTPDQANTFLVQTTLARFPNTGAIVAAATDAKAHEWDTLGHGIFTHELLSGLRGGADINRDRRIEYSEVYAFMAAANREVGDARARLMVVAKPPDVNRRTALLTLSDFPKNQLAWLAGVPGRQGVIEVGDARGRRLLTLHGDAEFHADVLVPANALLYVRGGDHEASFRAGGGEIVAYERLVFAGLAARSRGALDDAIRRGLFAAPYGRSYYDGVVDQMPSFIAVDFPVGADASGAAYWRTARFDGLLGAPKLVLGGGLSVGVANEVPLTHGVKVGIRPAHGSGAAFSAHVLRAVDGPLTEWNALASVGYLWSIPYGPVRGWGGAALGGGVLAQAVEGRSTRHSAAASFGPVLGLSVDLGSSLGLWSEFELAGLLHRRDARSVVSFAPTGWLGASWRL